MDDSLRLLHIHVAPPKAALDTGHLRRLSRPISDRFLTFRLQALTLQLQLFLRRFAFEPILRQSRLFIPAILQLF